MELDRTSDTRAQFVKTVWQHYARAGRHTLPWRTAHDAYHILVSETMLQQTQVIRVEPKYRAFIDRFPTLHTLAHAPQSEVLRAWQGLGYNRRALALMHAAQQIIGEHSGTIPRERALLEALPGIGPYTAGAVRVFAYEEPDVLVETNIRTALFHHFFQDRTMVSDAELLAVLALLVDHERPRDWYYALMDYGSSLKSQGIRTNMQSRHYVKQSRFRGSDREIRGTLLRVLLRESALSKAALVRKLPFAKARTHAQLDALAREGLIVVAGRNVRVP